MGLRTFPGNFLVRQSVQRCWHTSLLHTQTHRHTDTQTHTHTHTHIHEWNYILDNYVIQSVILSILNRVWQDKTALWTFASFLNSLCFFLLFFLPSFPPHSLPLSRPTTVYASLSLLLTNIISHHLASSPSLYLSSSPSSIMPTSAHSCSSIHLSTHTTYLCLSDDMYRSPISPCICM